MANPQESFMNDTLDAAPEGTLEEDEFTLGAEQDESTAPSWCSLTSSVARHFYENGRRYHFYRQGRYPIPNDDLEQSREEMKHLWVMELLQGKHYLAPIGDHPLKIADLGTGTGSKYGTCFLIPFDLGNLTNEVADKFPAAEVIGADLSPIQPSFCPPNLRFYVDNIEDEWAYGSDYDYIHLRHMGCFLKEPAKFLAAAFGNLKSGGWIEFQDVCPHFKCDDNSIPPDWPPTRSLEILNKAYTDSYGFDMDFAFQVSGELENAGFINVHQVSYKAPMSTWPKDETMRYIGWMQRETFTSFISTVGLQPMLSLGYSRSDANAFVAEVDEAMKDTRVHAWLPVVIVYGQKP